MAFMSGTRLYSLDAMRGVAAAMVVVYHSTEMIRGPVPSGYLAVDFFFILSGFVISRTYQSRLANGMSFYEFATRRIVRLYPLLALGLVLDALHVLQTIIRGKSDLTLTELAANFASQVAFLPSVYSPDNLFLLNPPSWSLFTELIVNGLFAWILFRLTTRSLVVVAIVTFSALSAAAIKAGNYDLGWLQSSAIPGIERTIFGFVVGMLLARFAARAVRQSTVFLLVTFVLVAIFVAKASLPYEALAIAILLPAIVYLGSQFEPGQRFIGLARVLGEASYPIYAIHWSLLSPLASVGRRIGLPETITIALTVAVIFSLGICVSRLYDAPVRRWIEFRLRKRVSAEAAGNSSLS